jgi:hypothetical protein
MIIVKTKVAEQSWTLFLFAPHSINSIIRVVFCLLSFSFYLLSLEDLREINPHKRKKERKKERRRSRTRRSRCTPRRHVVSFDRVFRVVSFWRGRSAPAFDLERHR